MASISSDSNGNRTIQFIAGDRRRRSIRLGKLDMKTTRDVKRRIEELNAAKISNQPLSRDLAEWLNDIEPSFNQRLVAVELVSRREEAARNVPLGEFLNDFLAKREGAKESTLSAIRVAINRMNAYFGEDAPIASITPGEADDWLTWMKVKKKYEPPTIARQVKHAKRFFRSALRLKLIKENPFEDLRGGSKQNNESRREFISLDVASKVLDALPDAEFRLIFALSRFAGLRCPSEHLALQWSDFDWEHSRFSCRSPKTGLRIVPIFSELKPYLDEVYDNAAEGSTNVISRRRASAQRWGVTLERALERAGIARWEKIIHNLRASRQTELSALYPIATVCRWLGNSIEVADLHYLSAMERDFERASTVGALHNPVHGTGEKCGEVVHSCSGTPSKNQEIVGCAKKFPEACKSQGG
jgi:integrase